MPSEPTNQLTSQELAELIVDALVVGGIIAESDVQRSILITVEEIDARKAVGDY